MHAHVWYAEAPWHPRRGGTRVGFGWVCAAQASKCGPGFRRDLQPK